LLTAGRRTVTGTWHRPIGRRRRRPTAAEQQRRRRGIGRPLPRRDPPLDIFDGLGAAPWGRAR
jgi:hypothetical protein